MRYSLKWQAGTMNRTFLIFRHEFSRTVRRTGFIVLTLALPVLALLGIGIFQIVSGIARPPAQVTKVGYVDEVGSFTQFTAQGNIDLVRYDTPEAAKQAIIKRDIAEYFIIPPDFLSTRTVNLFTTQKELAPPAETSATIKNFTSSNLLVGKVPADVITVVEMPLNLVTTLINSTGEVAPQQAGYANVIIPGVFALLLMFSLIFSSTYVLQSLGEEKENRLMEILLSSVSTRQLLAGKVLGLGAAGLIQVLVWLISFPLLLKLASSSIGGFVSTIRVPANFWIRSIIYFILGYLLFAVLSSSLAAITSTVREAQGMAGLYGLFSVAPLWFFSFILLYPNSPVWVVFSIFPFSAPVLVMIRLGITGVPAWQLAASLAVLALSVVGGLFMAAKLLRIYTLMYGKRPRLGEIIRNLRA
jgi:ABC-2 type transport system permease protein